MSGANDDAFGFVGDKDRCNGSVGRTFLLFLPLDGHSFWSGIAPSIDVDWVSDYTHSKTRGATASKANFPNLGKIP